MYDIVFIRVFCVIHCHFGDETNWGDYKSLVPRRFIQFIILIIVLTIFNDVT